jgi:hypothetical protein
VEKTRFFQKKRNQIIAEKCYIPLFRGINDIRSAAPYIQLDFPAFMDLLIVKVERDRFVCDVYNF